MKTVVLLSGGIDSSVLLRRLAADGRELVPLFIDYGQRARWQELESARWQCHALRLPLQSLDMASVGEAFRAGEAKKHHVPIPQRNLVALGLGVAWADKAGAEGIALAVNRDDGGDYAGAAPAFLAAFTAAVETLGRFRLETPLVDRSKADVIRLGAGLRVDFGHTYSCLLGHARQCGRCLQCRKRRAAFAAAGVAEPDRGYEGD
jgi:7-cyano-7-deazaguanine synthase